MKNKTLVALVSTGTLALSGCEDKGNFNKQVDYPLNGVIYQLTAKRKVKTEIVAEKRYLYITDGAQTLKAVDNDANHNYAFDEIIIKAPDTSNIRLFLSPGELEKAYDFAIVNGRDK